MTPVHYFHLSQISKFSLRMLYVIGLLTFIFGAVRLPAQATDSAPSETPQTELAVPPSLFGVEMSFITVNQGLNQMAAAGAYWVRPKGVYWSEVQPVEGQQPDWSALSGFEAELDNAESQGMQVIVVVRSAPDWAQAIPGVSCGPIDADHLDEFGDFLHALVNRYKDQVSYWELWNEPDVDPDLVPVDSPFGCWGDEDDEFYGGGYYADMLKAAYPRIKEADPDAQVLLGGLLLDCDPVSVCPDEKSAKFLDGILQNDGGQYFDGVSFHAYDYYLGELGKFFNDKWQSAWNTTGPVSIAKAHHLRSRLDSYGLSGKYLLNTESAVFCSTGCDDVYETTKAYYLAKSYSSAYDSRLQANIWFAARSGFRNTDLLNADLSPKPAYDAYKFSQSKLHAAEYIGAVGGYPGVSGYEFRLGNCPSTGEYCRLLVIWSLDGLDHLIELPDIPYAVYGVEGTTKPINLQMTVSLEPVYIELPLMYRVRMPVTVREYKALVNGGFEAGADPQGGPSGWVASSGGDVGLDYSLVSDNPTNPVLDPEIPIGSYSILLGNPDYPCNATGVPLGYAAVEQTFSVPSAPDGTSLSLDFSYVMYTQDEGASPQFDRFEVYIDDGTAPTLVYWDGRPNEPEPLSCFEWYRIPDTGWQQVSIDLLQPVDYRGKLITVSFQNWSRYDNWFNTLTYLDEVKLVSGD